MVFSIRERYSCCCEREALEDFSDTLYLLKKNIFQVLQAPTMELERRTISQISYLKNLKKRIRISEDFRRKFELAIQTFEELAIQTFEERNRCALNSKRLSEDLQVFQNWTFSYPDSQKVAKFPRKVLKEHEELLRRINAIFHKTQEPFFLANSEQKILQALEEGYLLIEDTIFRLKKHIEKEKKSLRKMIASLTKKVKTRSVASFGEINQIFSRVENQMIRLSYPNELRKSFNLLSNQFDELCLLYDKSLKRKR